MTQTGEITLLMIVYPDNKTEFKLLTVKELAEKMNYLGLNPDSLYLYITDSSMQGSGNITGFLVSIDRKIASELWKSVKGSKLHPLLDHKPSFTFESQEEFTGFKNELNELIKRSKMDLETIPVIRDLMEYLP